MTQTEIETIEKQLRELLDDEGQIRALHEEQSRALETLKTEEPRNFAGRADLEAKRSALSTMLQEQAQAIAQARARIQELKEQQAREARIAAFRKRLPVLRQHQEETDRLMLELSQSVQRQLEQITTARSAWDRDLKALHEDVREFFDLQHFHSTGGSSDARTYPAVDAWHEAFAALGEGAEELLRQTPFGERRNRFGYGAMANPYVRPDHLTPVGAENSAYQFARGLSLTDFFDEPVATTLGQALVRARQSMPSDLQGVSHTHYSPIESYAVSRETRGGSTTSSDYSM